MLHLLLPYTTPFSFTFNSLTLLLSHPLTGKGRLRPSLVAGIPGTSRSSGSKGAYSRLDEDKNDDISDNH